MDSDRRVLSQLRQFGASREIIHSHVMEDLAEQGFTTADMFQSSDFSHALQLFVELGNMQFHLH